MSLVAALLRCLLLAVFAAGISLPAAAMPAAQDAAQAIHPCPDAGAPQTPMPQDESCRQHCLGASLLTAPAIAATGLGRVQVIAVVLIDSVAPSLWPHPEGHPPRA